MTFVLNQEKKKLNTVFLNTKIKILEKRQNNKKKIFF